LNGLTNEIPGLPTILFVNKKLTFKNSMTLLFKNLIL